MIRRWMVGLVLALVVAIFASGGFASTAKVDVPPSNAGVVTVQVQITAPQPVCGDIDGESQPSGVEDDPSADDQVCEIDDAEDNILAPFLDDLPD